MSHALEPYVLGDGDVSYARVQLFFVGLSTIQTASIFADTPLILIMVGLMAPMQAVRQELGAQKGWQDEWSICLHVSPVTE